MIPPTLKQIQAMRRMHRNNCPIKSSVPQDYGLPRAEMRAARVMGML